jgi:hypothetical protein
VDELDGPVEERVVPVDEPPMSRIPPVFLGFPLARLFPQDIELSLRDPLGESGIGRKAKVHTAGQLAAAAG